MTGLLILLLVVTAVAVTVALLRRPQEAGTASPRPGAGTPGATRTPDVRADAAAALLARLGERLRDGSRRQVTALAAPGDRSAARELGTLRDNVRAAGITDLSFRYVSQDPVATAGRAPGEWVGRVQMSWRFRGFDRSVSVLELPVAFRDDGARAGFVTARQPDRDATPLWMLTRVSVERSARSLVLTARPSAARRFSRLADHAVADVRRVLHGWRGRLVVEVPAGQRGLTRVLGSEPGAYSEIAAVTTTADGSASRAAPVHIFVNPRVFDPLGPRGSQIVMSHEATHVATGAALSPMPTWLLEGFADYVALAHVDLSVGRAAGQALARVRRDGPPGRLPGKREFAPTNQALGASYEAAWLACRLLAEQHGERRLVAFYRAANRSPDVTGPFRTVLGTDLQSFTRAWRAYLRRLAG